MTRPSVRAAAAILAPAALVIAAYGVWLQSFTSGGGDVRTFVNVGTRYLQRSEGTAYPVTVPAGFPVVRGDGYDGQWVYFIARDPLHARFYVDDPPYRYGRILYPALVRLLSWGRAELMPGVMLGLNFAWLVVGTLALAAWLRRRGDHPYLALIYGLFPGLFAVLQLDLTEAMAFGLVAVAMLVATRGDRAGRLLAGLTFGLAALTRDQSLLFGAAYAAYELLHRSDGVSWRDALPANFLRALELGLPALLPLVGWDLVILGWLHAIGPDTSPFERLPYLGLWVWLRGGVGQLITPNVTILLPTSLICAFVCVWAAYRHHFSAQWLALVLNTVVIIFMDRGEWHDFTAGGRASTGMVLAAVTLLPAARGALAGARAWLYASAALWLSMVPATLAIPDLLYLHGLLRH